MQTNEFEKKVQDKLEGFELLPDSEVWKQVAARIAKEKKRRTFLLFGLLAGFLLLSGSAIYWYINQKSTNVSLVKNNKVNQSISSENVPGSKPALTEIKKDKKIDKIIVKANNSLQTAKKQKSTSEKLSKDQLQKPAITYTNKPGKVNSLNEFSSKITRDKQAALTDLSGNKLNDKTRFETRQNLLPHKYLQSGNVTSDKIDSATKTLAAKEKADTKKDTLISSSVKKTSQSKKKWKFGFTVYAGTSDNLSGLPLSSNTNSSQTYSTPSTSGSVTGNPNSITFLPLNYKSGFSFGLGFFINEQLTKKLSVSTGVDYHFLTARSSVGSNVNAQRSFYDSTLRYATLASSYYNSGQGIDFTNTYHKIALPVNLQLQINKNQNKPFLVSAGISPAYVIAVNGLYANKTTNTYYADKRQYKRFQLSGQTGLLYTFTSGKNYKLSAGPFVQYDFTNLTKTITGTVQHLFFAGIKTNISLK